MKNSESVSQITVIEIVKIIHTLMVECDVSERKTNFNYMYHRIQ